MITKVSLNREREREGDVWVRTGIAALQRVLNVLVLVAGAAAGLRAIRRGCARTPRALRRRSSPVRRDRQ